VLDKANTQLSSPLKLFYRIVSNRHWQQFLVLVSLSDFPEVGYYTVLPLIMYNFNLTGIFLPHRKEINSVVHYYTDVSKNRLT